MGLRCPCCWLTTATVIWICWSFVCIQGLLGTLVEYKDYCTYEAFEAECPEGHVITIQQAVFGRMKSGRCITDGYRMGCQADVTRHLANLCSGRSQCHMMVGTLDSIVQPCDKDLKSYLEASYHCIHVNYAKPCHQRERTVLLTQTNGFISPYNPSAYTLDLGIVCPWEIKAEAGQRINISLVSLFTGDQPDPAGCPIEVVLREDGKQAKTFDLCDLNTPMQLYSSKSHILYVDVKGQYSKVIQKLLKYQVHGCPNIHPAQGVHIRREGDTMAVICNASQATWYLTCKDGEWVGQPGNCSAADINPKSAQPSGDITLAVIVGVALGTFFGACMLCLVYFIRKRNRRARRDTITTELQYEPGLRTASDVIGSAHMTTTQLGPQQCQAVICHTKRREPDITEYTHVWNVHPPSVCTERQYSASTFNPNYDHSCVTTLQPTYDSTPLAASGAGGATKNTTRHSSLKNISACTSTPPLKSSGKEAQPQHNPNNNSAQKRRSAGNLLEEIPPVAPSNNGNNGSGSMNNNNTTAAGTATLGTRTHFCELHGNV